MPRRNRTIRNHVARSPLLRKGGVHIQSKTGQRARAKLKVSSAIDEWQEEIIEDTTTQGNDKGSESSPFLLTEIVVYPPRATSYQQAWTTNNRL